MKKNGTLLIIDYPEETRAAIGELLRDLSFIRSPGHIRILFLTRQPISEWLSLIHESKATDIVSMTPLELGPLDTVSANMIYNSALDDAGEVFETVPKPVPLPAMEAWAGNAPENRKALFVVAAAVLNSMHPNDPIVTYCAKEVIAVLAQREIDRLNAIATSRSLREPLVFARVLAMAAIAGKLSAETIQTRISTIGFGADVDIDEELHFAGILSDGFVCAPTPDILAAGFVRQLSRKPQTASELVWLALEKDSVAGLARIGRLSHDAEAILRIYDYRLSIWLQDAVGGNLERCKVIEPFLSESPLPIALTACAVICNQTLLLEHVNPDERRAWLLNNLAVQVGRFRRHSRCPEANPGGRRYLSLPCPRQTPLLMSPNWP